MKKVKLTIVFLVFFVAFLFIFMPYGKIYKSAIDKFATKENIKVSYDINKASLLRLNLGNIKFFMPNKTIAIDACKIKINPFGLVFNSNIARIRILTGNNTSNFVIKKSKNKYFIKGKFKTIVLKNFLDKNLSSFLSGFKGTDNMILVMRYKKNRIIIEKLEISGDFELVAHGYIQGNVLRLMGVVKIGNIKENFSI